MRMNKKIRINLVILIAVIISIYILSITRSKNITIQVDGGVIEYKGSGESVEEVIDEAIKVAKQAVEESDRTKPRFIALDIGPIGEMLEPIGKLSFEKATQQPTKPIAISTTTTATKAAVIPIGSFKKLTFT